MPVSDDGGSRNGRQVYPLPRHAIVVVVVVAASLAAEAVVVVASADVVRALSVTSGRVDRGGHGSRGGHEDQADRDDYGNDDEHNDHGNPDDCGNHDHRRYPSRDLYVSVLYAYGLYARDHAIL